MTRQTLVIVLGGGQGERLYPLTRDRAKPAVPFGGCYRIIDFTLSNCVNSGLRRVYVLTQYKSFSLDRHLRLALDALQRGDRRVHRADAAAAAHRRALVSRHRRRDLPEHLHARAGAPGVRPGPRRRPHLQDELPDDARPAPGEAGGHHRGRASKCPSAEGPRFGVVAVDETMRIVGFEEKPANPRPLPGRPDVCLASMGIYAFTTDALVQLVTEDAKRDSTHDFGRDILPRVMRERPIYAYLFQDENRKAVKYWRDIGTLDAYYQANMDLVAVDPLFNLYDAEWPIRTHLKQRPPAKFVFDEAGGRRGMAVDSIVSHGCIIAGGQRRAVRPLAGRPGRGARPRRRMHPHGQRHRRRRRAPAAGDRGQGRRHSAAGARVGSNLAADRKKFTVTESGIVVIPKGVPRGEEFWRA